MGEVVVSSEGGTELEVQATELETEIPLEAENKNKNQKDTAEGGGAAAAGGGSVVRWERFLPKMAVRVLLVEADDSTRQIIAALLRKCSYRVAAVPDGLKAWEVLKERSHNIDLILTEVELPSISGYALLTLIMEHEVCKNIPVIMMSSQDSVSTVYKCMLKGATDFLVKPVRKNELRNLWQHVWRKQASSTGAGIGPTYESVAQEKDEASAENNAISNHSSGYISSIQKNLECLEKGSDDQSSCTKPESETQGEDFSEDVHCLSQPKRAKTPSNDDNTPTEEEIHQESKRRRMHESESEELLVTAIIDANRATPRNENVENNHVIENSSREAIDLIGTFDNHFRGSFGSFASNVGANKFDMLPMLDLSLRRSHPSGTTNHVNDEWPRLNHSDASAFSRYVNKPMQLSNSTSPNTFNQQKDNETNSEKQLSKNALDHNPETHSPTLASQRHVSMHENTFPYTQNQEISHPIPVRGIRFENLVSTHNSSIYSSKTGPSPLPSPATPHHTESFPRSNHFYPSDRLVEQRITDFVDQTDNKPCEKLENSDDCGLVSPGNDQSGNSSLCTGNSKINGVSVIKTAPSEGGNEESLHVHEGASNRSMQREAALTKFRLKRKDRCFEKKVRYESRKKLAEQRPRVKGQFVRQLPNDSQLGNSSAG